MKNIIFVLLCLLACCQLGRAVPDFDGYCESIDPTMEDDYFGTYEGYPLDGKLYMVQNFEGDHGQEESYDPATGSMSRKSSGFASKETLATRNAERSVFYKQERSSLVDSYKNLRYGELFRRLDGALEMFRVLYRGLEDRFSYKVPEEVSIKLQKVSKLLKSAKTKHRDILGMAARETTLDSLFHEMQMMSKMANQMVMLEKEVEKFFWMEIQHQLEAERKFLEEEAASREQERLAQEAAEREKAEREAQERREKEAAERAAAEEFARKQRAKGLVEYKGEWMTPKEMETKREEDRVLDLIRQNSWRELHFKVFQVFDDGIALCHPVGKPDDVFCLLFSAELNRTVVDGNQYANTLWWAGVYSYTTVRGARKKVNLYAIDASEAIRSVKEQGL